jgi:predicted GIY-YIG superfamily endonuclease
MKGYMYILKCSDDSYYVGSTKYLELRVAQHKAGRGANHTKKRLPVELVYYEVYNRIDEAFYREKQVQGWGRKKKEALIENKPDNLHSLAACKNETHYANRWLCGIEATSIKEPLGNIELLKQPKIAFLCSRKVPASLVLKCYDWAIEQRERKHCVISGFHSQIEKDVLHYLLKGKQPIILVLARGLKENLEPEFVKPLEQGRLLIITPFDKSVKRVSNQTAQTRNQLMASLANQIIIGYASPSGQLEALLKEIDKPMYKIV